MLVVRVPVEDGGRLVVALDPQQAQELARSLNEAAGSGP